MNLQDTIVALATPAGTGAIGVIRLSGKEALTISEKMFSKSLKDKDSHTIHLGKLRDTKGQLLDEPLVSVFKAPTSYTKENVVEISCHGSRFILQRVLDLCIELGARLAEPGEFTLRAFLNGQMDLSQAEAVADLIAAESEAAHQIALQQMRGGFSHEIQALRAKLIDFASLIELELDFSEEDVEFANRAELETLIEQLQSMIKRLLDSFRLGNVLKNGVSTVLAGRPNAGKSTLLNALLQEERAIVSDIAGTTRDTIEEVMRIRGVEFRLIDTAGIREADNQIEAIGVEKTYEKIKQSALLVYVYDAATLAPEELQQDLARLARPDLPMLILANKMDKVAQFVPPQVDAPVLPLSAAEGAGLPELLDTLYQLVVDKGLDLDQSLVSNSRHYEALQHAAQDLYQVQTGLQSGIPGDLLAQDIRHALAQLGHITGEVSSDDLLGNIFSNFCIGK